MVNAIVLINVERVELKNVIQEILKTKGVTEVYAVAGEYDLVAIVRVADNTSLSEIVVDKMPHHIPGITYAKTLFALETYSNLDLAKLFDIKK
jgi:DNA-binding Lrp family transcriptional regulator